MICQFSLDTSTALKVVRDFKRCLHYDVRRTYMPYSMTYMFAVVFTLSHWYVVHVRRIHVSWTWPHTTVATPYFSLVSYLYLFTHPTDSTDSSCFLGHGFRPLHVDNWRHCSRHSLTISGIYIQKSNVEVTASLHLSDHASHAGDISKRHSPQTSDDARGGVIAI